ncbi:MAG: HAMP domain-containing histidine kinase [Cyclobacteriaceae bacterium]|nr:HAMP domain-containing histidine kinase [Cyclobacteriaceae bacterium]
MSLRNSLLLLLLSVLLISGGLLIRSQYAKSFHGDLLIHIQKNAEAELVSINADAKKLISNLSVNSTSWDEVDHFFVHADSTHIISWNRSDFLPDLTSFSGNDSIVFIKSQRGDFLLKRWNLPDRSTLYCVLELADRYPIINNFLSSQWNSSIFPVRDLTITSPLSFVGESVSVDGRVLFKIIPEKPDVHESGLSFLLIALAFFIIGILTWNYRRIIEKSYGYDVTLVFLFVILLGVRMGMIAINFPAMYLATDLFDPKKFASSSLNASMGDLFFNSLALLILVSYLFWNFKEFRTVQWMLQRSGIQRAILGTVCLLACFFALLFPYDFIESIYHNSTLALDLIQSLSFDKVVITAITSVLIGCISSFLIIHVLFALANHLFEKSNISFFIGLVVAAGIFVAQSYLLNRDLSVTLFLGLLFFSVLKISRINGGVFRISFQVFIYLIFSLSIFSYQNASAIRVFYKERQLQDQFRFGKDFLMERDVLGEYLLDDTRQKIQKDQFIQTRLNSPFLSKSAVVDKIRRVYLNNYFDRYEISITTKKTEQIAEELFEDSDSVVSPISFIPTDYPGISYAKATEGNTVKRYHVRIPIYYQRMVGIVQLDLSLKRVIPQNVYPELLIDNRFNQIYRNKDFSYAIFTKGELITSFGPFNYEKGFPLARIDDPLLYSAGVVDRNYSHIGIEDSDGSVAIVSASSYPSFYLITNFSFWFAVGLASLFIAQLIAGSFSYSRGEKFNYTSRIQLFIFFAFLLPVLAVSITTLTLIGKSNEEGIEKDFLERSGTISERIAGLIALDSLNDVNEVNLESWIEENAVSSKIDISVYTPAGKLIATSQPALFDNQLISPLLDRNAWKEIVLEKEIHAVTSEQIGKLKYSCAYSSVLSPETGKLLAIVGLPFFESATFLQRSQSLIISNILIVFVIVFVLFSLLSFWASSSLTFPIKFITKTLGQTTLTGQNKPIQWNSSDEIGTLVKEYNKMVQNLVESKDALALSEKENAWREMAKQVAHEIKNPLTPMKLTLQQMEQALKMGNIPLEKSQKSVDVLLKQVEILNEIATSFSTFASMPAPSPQAVDLNDTLQTAANLFADESSGRVVCHLGSDSCKVLVDLTSFSRALSNIIINAIQSRKEEQRQVEVSIGFEVNKNSVLITIRDNGKGMSKEVQERVFQPQFTTKQSGSGLGLAMTRQIIHQAGGKIWFESIMDQGTTFFIELPVV